MVVLRALSSHARAKMEKQGASSVLVTSAHPAVPGHGGPDSKAIRGLRNLKSCESWTCGLGSKAPDVHLEKGHLGVHLHGVNNG